MANLAIPEGVNADSESWRRLQDLNARNPEAAGTILSDYNAGRDHTQAAFDQALDAYTSPTGQARFRGVTSAGSGLNAAAARFASVAKVIPLRSEAVPPAANAALDTMARIDMADGNARAGLVTGIEVAVRPA